MEFNIEYKIKPPKGLHLNWQELWRYRELFYFFTWRDIKVKYKQTMLGFLWAILQPLLMMLVFTFFFGKTLNVPSNNIPYPIFVFSGLLLWNIFASGLNGAGNSMVTNANIIKKIYFPRLVIPLSAILVALFDFLMGFLVYVGLLISYQFDVNIYKLLVFIPFSLIVTIMTTFGVGSLLAALNVKYRDFRYVIPFLVQILLFLTPVIYPVSIFESQIIHKILAINPMSGAINIFRGAIVDQPLDWELISISMVSCIFFFLIGLFYFRKTESYFADIA